MRYALFLALIIMVMVSIHASAGENHTCRITSGYGTAIGVGETKLKAKENARLACGDKLIDDYIARRGRISAEAEDDIIDLCVNAECS